MLLVKALNRNCLENPSSSYSSNSPAIEIKRGIEGRSKGKAIICGYEIKSFFHFLFLLLLTFRTRNPFSGNSCPSFPPFALLQYFCRLGTHHQAFSGHDQRCLCPPHSLAMLSTPSSPTPGALTTNRTFILVIGTTFYCFITLSIIWNIKTNSPQHYQHHIGNSQRRGNWDYLPHYNCSPPALAAALHLSPESSI